MHLGEKALQYSLRGGNIFKSSALPNTLQSECIHVTFSCNEEKFFLLQLTGSVRFKTQCI